MKIKKYENILGGGGVKMIWMIWNDAYYTDEHWLP